ncbi:MAG: T9SS type A sorting domain-containing protein [bacterium]
MKIKFIFIALYLLCYLNITAKVWTISPDGEYKFCSEISSLIADSDTIEIENGTYENDKQVSWSKNNLLIRGVNGKPVLRAGSKIANDNSNGKGIFVIRGNNTTVENIEFQNAKVIDWNGAGIRQEGSNLIVRYCTFKGNEMGILQGGTISDCKILIEYCKFYNCGSPEKPGYQHNIYINHIDTLVFRYNFTYDAIAEGHEFKSRANNNYILYNRISNINTVDSRNIDLPNGGTAVILGNVLEQGENSTNSNIIGFGLEELINPAPHNLWICNNTIVNRKSKGSFVQVANIDTLFMKNNICVGAKTGGFIIGSPAILDTAFNYINENIQSPMFLDLDSNDYHLKPESPAVNSGIDLENNVNGISLKPTLMYKDHADFEIRPIAGILDIGAFEYGSIESIYERIRIDDEIKIFPNPASNTLIINYNYEDDNELNFYIFSLTGLKINNTKEQNLCNGKIAINISSLSIGKYFIVFERGTSKCIKSFNVIR